MFADQEAPEWLPANVMRFARYVYFILFNMKYSLKNQFEFSQKLLSIQLLLEH